jgi:hypothetical protein
MSINEIKRSSPYLSPVQEKRERFNGEKSGVLGTLRHKRESNIFDENMNFATPLINIAPNCRKKMNGSTGKF